MNATDDGPALAEQVAGFDERLMARRWQFAVAESLTEGMLATALAEGPDAAEWFKGGIVAYQLDVKWTLLSVSDGPVVSQRCACEMAAGIRVALESDIGVALTDVAGPTPAEGHDPGNVWLGADGPNRVVSRSVRLTGRPPAEVCALSCVLALQLAREVLDT